MFDDGALIALHRAGQYLYRLTAEFGLAGCALALFGIGLLWRRDRALAIFLGLIVAVAVLYACNFSIFDIYTYYLPLHIVWGALLAAGAAAALTLGVKVIEAVRRSTGSLTPSRQHALVTAFLLTIPFALFTAHLPLVDGSDDWGSERFARAVFRQVEHGAVVLADWWTIAPLGYLQHVEGERLDVIMYAAPSMYACDGGGMVDFLEHDFIQRYPAVYFVEMLTYQANLVRERCYLVPEGPVARVLADRPDPEALLADIPAESSVRFGDRVGLVASEVEAGELRPGQCLDFTLYWMPLEEYPGRPHQAILMLENDEAGRIWQESNLLGHDLFPLEEWTQGQVLTERHRIYLPDPVEKGTYNLLVRVREHGTSECFASDRPASADNPRDYRIASISVREADDPSARGRLPTLLALLRP
jgi:hypothetical protein